MATFVLRYDGDGKPYLQDKAKLNDFDESKDLHYVQPDFEPYQSPIDGKIISGRRARRYDLQRSGSREYEGRASEVRAAQEYRATQEKKLERSMMERARWINA